MPTAGLPAALLAIVAVGAAAAADEIYLGKLPVPTTIVDAKDFVITYRSGGGRIRQKALSEITMLQISGRADFNEGERLLRDGKPAEAAKAYDRAFRNAIQDWLRRLIRYRRLAALDAAGLIDRAAEEWLIVADELNASPASLRARPSTPGEKGSRRNARAIALLAEKLKSVRQKAYQQAASTLLLELYEKEGRHEEAEALIRAVGLDRPRPEGEPKTRPGPAVGALAGRLKAAAFLVRRAERQRDAAVAGEAIRALEADRLRCNRDELETALLLMGRAQMIAYENSPKKDRELLLQAGLNFMRVATFYPFGRNVPEAMYRAGEVNAALGNQAAALNAFRMVVQRHGDSEFARAAAGAIEGLSKARDENPPGR
jgi:hypothetical protein